MSKGAKVAIGIGVIALIAFLWLFVSPYNELKTLRENVTEAQANIETDLQRRYDLIPNLVETVKGYAAHEKETLQGVIAARNQFGNARDLQGKLQADAALQSALGRLMVVVERYPELKANQNFLDLQAQLEGTENRITVARTRFNRAVKDYNLAVETLPTMILARLMGFGRMEMFKADAPAQQAPKVKF